MRRVLFITVAAPPSVGSHATRVAALVDQLHAEGYEVTLLTVSSSTEQKAASALYGRLSAKARVLEADGGALRAAAKTVSADAKRLWKAKIIQRLRAAVRSVMIPDTFATWIPAAVRIAKRHLRDDGADLIISSGAPFSSHIVGLLASRATGVPFVSDYGDPWVYEPGRPRSGLRLLIERWLEQRVLRASTLASLATIEATDLYRKRYPEVNTPYFVFPMGYAQSDYVTDCSTSTKSLNVVYTGRINEEYRTIDGLTDALQQVEARGKGALQVQFFGGELSSVAAKLRRYIDSGLVHIGPNLDHDEYIRTIRTAAGLLIFGNNSPVQIPGKIAHFVAARRPILYFPNTDDRDPALELLQRVQLTNVHVYRGPSDFENFLTDCQLNGISPEYDENELDALSWEGACARYLEAIRAALNWSRPQPGVNSIPSARQTLV